MATYKVQIDDVVSDATPAEVAEIEARQAEVVAQAEAQAVKASARVALLEKLGITETEAQLLLGS